MSYGNAMYKWLVRITWTAAGLFAAVLILVVGNGRAHPETHVGRASAIFASTSPVALFEVLADHEGVAERREDVDRVERLDDRDGHPVFRETSAYGDEIEFVILEEVPNTRMVVEIGNADALGFGGTWTWELAPDGQGSRVVVTEEGQIPGLIMRGVYWMFASPTGTIEAELALLGRHLQDPPVITIMSAQ